MAMQRGHKVAVIAGAVGVGVLIAWLLAGKGATAAAAPMAATAPGATGGGDFPPQFYNLTFQQPATVTPGQGYVPLFGFIGFGSSYY